MTYSECVLIALGIQHAMRVRHIILLSVASPALHYFSTLFHKRHDFRKKVVEHKMCDFLYNFRLKHHSKKIWRDMTKNAYWSSCKLSVIRVGV